MELRSWLRSLSCGFWPSGTKPTVHSSCNWPPNLPPIHAPAASDTWEAQQRAQQAEEDTACHTGYSRVGPYMPAAALQPLPAVIVRVPRRKPVPARKYGMDKAALEEVLSILDSTIGHIPFIVAGRAALCIWGCHLHAPAHVSIFCATGSRDVIRCWTRTSVDVELFTSSSRTPYPSTSSTLAPGGVSKSSDRLAVKIRSGRIHHVRIRYLDAAAFERLPRLRGRDMGPGYNGALGRAMAECAAQVLALPALLDELARAWVADPRIARDPARQQALAADVRWVLRRIEDGGFVEEGAPPLTAEAVPHVVDPAFWKGFLAKNADARDLFLQAGLDVDQVFSELDEDDGASLQTLWSSNSTAASAASGTTVLDVCSQPVARRLLGEASFRLATMSPQGSARISETMESL